MPGPGNYADQKSSFGKTLNAPTMTGKHTAKINLNPGPGHYDADVSKIKAKAGTAVRIGSAQRKEIWVDQS